MAPRETENNTYVKFWGDKQIALWYFWSAVNILGPVYMEVGGPGR